MLLFSFDISGVSAERCCHSILIKSTAHTPRERGEWRQETENYHKHLVKSTLSATELPFFIFEKGLVSTVNLWPPTSSVHRHVRARSLGVCVILDTRKVEPKANNEKSSSCKFNMKLVCAIQNDSLFSLPTYRESYFFYYFLFHIISLSLMQAASARMRRQRTFRVLHNLPNN